jgi:hypothetical protein
MGGCVVSLSFPLNKYCWSGVRCYFRSDFLLDYSNYPGIYSNGRPAESYRISSMSQQWRHRVIDRINVAGICGWLSMNGAKSL